MAEDENKTECPTCQSCTKWKVGFIMCLICSLIMFILCIVLWAKRNAIHEAVYSRVRDYTTKRTGKYNKGSENMSDNTTKRGGINKGGEFRDNMEGGSIFY